MDSSSIVTRSSTTVLNWEEQGTVSSQRKLADFVQTLQQQAEVNNYNIPLTYVDPTVIAECIPWCDSADDIPEDKYKTSIVPIDFEDGLPSANGLPIWERLDGELLPYYSLFKQYRDMKYYNNTHLNNRSIARLAEELNISGKNLTILSKIFHWVLRAKSFDIYKSREIDLRRQRDIEALENKHSKVSGAILDQAFQFLKENIKQLNPKTALEMLELGMKYGRISAGLLGDKPGQHSGSVHQTNIAIQSNSSTQVDQSQNGVVVNPGTGSQSAAERKLNDNLKDTSNLASILHVLNRSGALASALPVEVLPDDGAPIQAAYSSADADEEGDA